MKVKNKIKINKSVVYVLLPFIVLLVGFILRVWKFNYGTYAISELQQVNIGEFPVSEMLRGHFSSPVYYFLLHIWLKIVPFDEVSARFFSIFMGTMALIPLYFLVLRLKDRNTALIAGYLASISPFYIFHSRVVGSFSLALLLILSSIILFMKVYEEKNDIYNSISYAVVTLLMLYSTPAGGLILLCEWCWLTLKWQVTKQKLRVWLINQGGIILGYLYWVIKLFGKSFTELQEVVGYNLWGRFLYVLHSFSLGQAVYPLHWKVTGPAVFVLGLVIFFGIISLRKQRRITVFLWPLFFLNLVPIFWVCGAPEYCMGASIAYFIVIALGLSALKLRSAVMALSLITYFSLMGVVGLMLH